MEFNLEGYIKRDENWVNMAKEVYAIQEKRRQLEKLETVMMAQLKSISNEQNSHGGGFILESSLRLGNIDYDSIPELKKINLERYRKDYIKTWKLKNLNLWINDESKHNNHGDYGGDRSNHNPLCMDRY